jgi:hypothetical protein
MSVGYFVLGLLDVLNQRQALQQWRTLPDGPDGKAKLLPRLQHSLGTILSLRSLFNKYVAALGEETLTPEQLASLTPDQRVEFNRLRDTKFGIQPFSDTVAFFSPLDHLRNIPILRDIYSVLLGSGFVQVMLLTGGVAARGAVEIGAAAALGPAEIYGPVLASAHHLESEIADYPRIVVGPELVKFLQEIERHPPTEPLWRMSSSIASTCLQAIFIDEDGAYTVDGLGVCLNQVDQTAGIKSQLLKARDFVDRELSRFQREGNHKLALRYARLRKCFDRHKAALAQP